MPPCTLACTDNDTFTYIGRTEGLFKTGYNCHMHTCTHDRYRNGTEVSKKAWKLKGKNVDYDISSKVLQRAHPYTIKMWLVCRREVVHPQKPSSLNKRYRSSFPNAYTKRNICWAVSNELFLWCTDSYAVCFNDFSLWF